MTTITRHPERMVRMADLKPFERNPRTHSPEQVKQIARSIAKWGWTNPLLIEPNGSVIAGHGRLLAAAHLGWTEVPAVTIEGLTADDKAALVVADNQLALNAGWDDGVLADLLAELERNRYDLGLIGMPDDQLARLLELANPQERGDPEETPETPENPVSELGDVWLLGKHRIVCGDSTQADVVAKALNGVAPHLMVTDPPYGVEYDASWRKKVGRNSGGAVGKVLNDDRADWREAWALFPGDVAYIWHAGIHATSVAESLVACDFTIRSQIIWAKSQFAIGRGDYHWQHEPAWYAVRGGRKGHYCGDRKQSTLWQIDKPKKSETGHSTQKPVECMARPVRNNSSPGQAVYEPFSGSGTTIIACDQEGRCCHAVELNPAYVDVAVLRWQTFVKGTATLESTGETFAEVAAHRKPGAVIEAAETTETPKRQSRGKQRGS